MRHVKFILVVSLSALMMISQGGCSSDPVIREDGEVPIETTTFSFDQGTYPSDIGLFKEYRIVPGDVLDILFQIQTWKVDENFKIKIDHTVSVKFIDIPEWNEEQRVLPNGCVTLPHIGQIKVVDKTIPEFTTQLKNRYAKILIDPDIYVGVTEFQSRIKELKQDLHTAPRGLSRLVTVRPDGHVTFPLVGDYFVGKKTIQEVNKMMNKSYDDYLPGLHVDLFLHETKGSVVYIFGEVNAPGTYKIERPLTSFQILSMAEGITDEAELESVLIFRKHERKVMAKALNLKDRLTLQKGAAFFYVRPDDLIYVPRRKLSTLAQTMTELQNIVGFRGWGISFGDDIDWVE